MPPRSNPSHEYPDNETVEEFLKRVKFELASHIGDDDWDRLSSLANRGAGTQWQPFSNAPAGEIEVLAYREDAGVFTAFRAELQALGAAAAEQTSIWYSTNGENLSADLPTHFIALESLGLPSGESV